MDLGVQMGGCPYFASRTLAADAELLLLPFNYLLDPVVRAASDIVLDDAIVIFDEVRVSAAVVHSCEDASICALFAVLHVARA